VEDGRIVGRNDDEQLGRKVRYVDDCLACARMIARQRDDNRFSTDWLLAETRIVNLGPDKTDVDPSVDQCLPLLHRPQVLKSEVDVRETLSEHSNHVGEWLVRCRGHVAHDEFAELAMLGALCGADGALGLGERLPRLREKYLSGRRELDPPLRPTKQAGAELILEAPYLLAQRRLRDVKSRSRPAEMQLFGHGEKGAEVSQLHARIISRGHAGGRRAHRAVPRLTGGRLRHR
jgi:hypothetical protein